LAWNCIDSAKGGEEKKFGGLQQGREKEKRKREILPGGGSYRNTGIREKRERAEGPTENGEKEGFPRKGSPIGGGQEKEVLMQTT